MEAGLRGLMGVASVEAERRACRGRRRATCLSLNILSQIRGQVLLQPAKKKNSRAVVLCLAPTSESFLISFSPPTESELWTPLKINHPEARLYSGSAVLPVIVS
jgi:hypothetical protein